MGAGSVIHWRKEWRLFWPDYDAAPERTHAYVLKHLPDVDMTVAAAAHHGLCIQAGGHVGLWPLNLAESFDRVLTYEPDPALFECLKRNTAKAPNITAERFALGASSGTAKLRTDKKAGSWAIDPAGTVEATVVTIDAMLEARGWPRCDAIVLDIEGYEVEALKGAAETLERFRPVLHVEELGPFRMRSSAFMKSIGYVERARAGRDGLYVHASDLARTFGGG
jgi:FkbM family methyltransferase